MRTKRKIFLLLISFTLVSITSLSSIYLHSLPTIYHPTLVHRQTRQKSKQQEKEKKKVTEIHYPTKAAWLKRLHQPLNVQVPHDVALKNVNMVVKLE